MTVLVYTFAVLKNIVYGLSVFFTQGLSENVDVLDILSLRFIMSVAALWLLKTLKIVKINIGVKDFFVKNKRTPYIKYVLITALFEPVLYMFFETTGVSMTSGITAGVILSLSPIATCVSERIFLKEKSTFMQNIFLLLGIIGVIYIAVNTNSYDGKDSFIGIMFVVLAVITGAIFVTFSRKSSKSFNAMEITYVSALLGMIAFNAVNIIRHIYMGTLTSYFTPYFNAENMVGFVFLAIISTIAATGMNNFALSRMQASTMAAFSGLSTLVTIAVGVIFGGETLYPFHIVGITLIVLRMVGVSYIQIKREKNNI